MAPNEKRTHYQFILANVLGDDLYSSMYYIYPKLLIETSARNEARSLSCSLDSKFIFTITGQLGVCVGSLSVSASGIFLRQGNKYHKPSQLLMLPTEQSSCIFYYGVVYIYRPIVSGIVTISYVQSPLPLRLLEQRVLSFQLELSTSAICTIHCS